MDDSLNRDLKAGYYAVAFIDLLGQKEAMRNLDHLPQNEEEKQKFISILKESAGVVDDLNKSLANFLNSSKDGGALEPEFMQILTDWEIKHQRFSDGLVLFSALTDTDKICPAVGVRQMLLACAALMFLSLAKGKPIRGGIDVGIGMELYPNEIYGPAVAKAYQLESSVAQYPRIVVGDTLREYLAQGACKNEKYLVDSIWKNTAEKSLSFICEDSDGHLIVDYLGEGVRSVFGDKVDGLLLERIEGFVGEQFETHKKFKNTKLIARYLLLNEYLKPRLPSWT